MQVRVKICGITCPEDAQAAVASGADAIGFILWEQSARFIPPVDIKKIVKSLPPFVHAVGVYVNPEQKWVTESAAIANLSLLQFHGDEPPEFCSQFHLPYIKAFRVREELDLLQCAQQYANARGLLLDAYRVDMPGGTGCVFDWKLIPADLPMPWVLSGGLDSENIVEAIRRTRPLTVDVSSGVERAPGIKDINKITAFMRGVRTCENL